MSIVLPLSSGSRRGWSRRLAVAAVGVAVLGSLAAAPAVAKLPWRPVPFRDFGAATLAQPATRAEHINFQTADEDEERVRATCGNTEPVDEDLVDRVVLDVACNHPIDRSFRSEHRDGNAAPSLGGLGGYREFRDPAVLVGRADRRNAS